MSDRIIIFFSYWYVFVIKLLEDVPNPWKDDKLCCPLLEKGEEFYAQEKV